MTITAIERWPRVRGAGRRGSARLVTLGMVTALTLAGMLAGCGSTVAPAARPRHEVRVGQVGQAAAAVPGPPAGSRRLAAALARAELALQALPRGCHRSSAPITSGQSLGAETTAVDVRREVSCPQSPVAALSFLQAHAPAGTVSAGSGGSAQRGVARSVFASFSLSRPPAGISTAMQTDTVQPAAAGSVDSPGSVVLIDMDVAWEPPRTGALLDPAAIRSVTVSVYRTSANGLSALRGTRIITSPAEVAAIIRMFDSLEPATGSNFGCGPGPWVVDLTFTPRSKRPAVVAAALPCAWVFVADEHLTLQDSRTALAKLASRLTGIPLSA